MSPRLIAAPFAGYLATLAGLGAMAAPAAIADMPALRALGWTLIGNGCTDGGGWMRPDARAAFAKAFNGAEARAPGIWPALGQGALPIRTPAGWGAQAVADALHALLIQGDTGGRLMAGWRRDAIAQAIRAAESLLRHLHDAPPDSGAADARYDAGQRLMLHLADAIAAARVTLLPGPTMSPNASKVVELRG